MGAFAPAYLAASVAAAVGLMAAWLINSRGQRGPMAMGLFLPTFWLLVPGSLAFVVVAGVLDENAQLAALIGSLGLTLVGMAIGIMIASLIYPYLAHAPTRAGAMATLTEPPRQS